MVHITSGNANQVLEQLDQGLIDFGLLSTNLDPKKYESLPVPYLDTWGVLMRKDSPLASKNEIHSEDLRDQPLILSQQKTDQKHLAHWIGKEETELKAVGTYNLLLNASLLVEEGVGVAIGYEDILHTDGSPLCFRPLSPKWSVQQFVVYPKYPVFSKAANLFLRELQGRLAEKKN